jgi:Caspase domain
MTERRFALIIACDDYKDPKIRKLNAPSTDGKALSSVLRDPSIGGYQVKMLLNEPYHKTNEEIEAFFAERDHDDLLLFYFAGHGIKDIDGMLYLASVDTNSKLLRSTSTSSNFIKAEIRNSHSRRHVLLLDCCYSGAFIRGVSTRADKKIYAPEAFSEDQGYGTFVLSSSDAMTYSFEGSSFDNIEQYGTIGAYFTEAIIEGLRSGDADLNKDNSISCDDLYKYVLHRVREKRPEQKLERSYFAGQGGDFIIAKKTTVKTKYTHSFPPVGQGQKFNTAFWEADSNGRLGSFSRLAWMNLTTIQVSIESQQLSFTLISCLLLSKNLITSFYIIYSTYFLFV